MDQTPITDQHNPALLERIPKNSVNLIEIGCSSGALAREFKKISPPHHYFGVEIVPEYAQLAKLHCDQTLVLDIEQADQAFFDQNKDCDCWIFGDVLEHLKDPWSILKKIRAVIPANGSVVACIPNAQHWSLQVKLCIGDFRYEPSGLLDKTHLRWFTRQTIIELFQSCGYQIVEGVPRIFDEPARETFLPTIKQLASLTGADPELAIADCLPFQYVIRAIPN